MNSDFGYVLFQTYSPSETFCILRILVDGDTTEVLCVSCYAKRRPDEYCDRAAKAAYTKLQKKREIYEAETGQLSLFDREQE